VLFRSIYSEDSVFQHPYCTKCEFTFDYQYIKGYNKAYNELHPQPTEQLYTLTIKIPITAATNKLAIQYTKEYLKYTKIDPQLDNTIIP
jgi:hypothetical protein